MPSKMKQEHSSFIPDLRPSFYQLVLSNHPASQEHMLIPPDATESIPVKFSESAILYIPTCNRHFHIKLNKTKKSIYLENGWQKFFKDNALGRNQLLEFTYDTFQNNSIYFNVKIFDRNGCVQSHSTIPKRNENAVRDSVVVKTEVMSEFCMENKNPKETLPKGKGSENICNGKTRGRPRKLDA